MNVFDIKTVIMTPLIKLIIKHPKIMKAKIFMKVMVYFPEKISESYDEKIQKSEIDYMASILDGLEYVDNKPQKIIDLCTGTGIAAISAAKYFPKAFVEGIDQSYEMVKISKEKAKRQRIKNLNFKKGNAANLLYKDNEFDLVITSNAPIYLSEISRVLKQGGEVLVSFSFSGKAFIKAEKEIVKLIEKNGLTLIKIKNVKKGVFILGQKRE